MKKDTKLKGFKGYVSLFCGWCCAIAIVLPLLELNMNIINRFEEIPLFNNEIIVIKLLTLLIFVGLMMIYGFISIKMTNWLYQRDM